MRALLRTACAPLVPFLLAGLASCGEGTGSDEELWELRVPATKVAPDGRSLRAVYQVLGRTPIVDALVRIEKDEIGLTLRARLPDTIIAIAWGFRCVEIPLPEAASPRRIVDGSKRRYPGSESGIDDRTARTLATRLLEEADEKCARLSSKRVRVAT